MERKIAKLASLSVRPKEHRVIIPGPVIYFDRRIWKYYDYETGSEETTIERIPKMFGKEIKEEEVVVLQPYTFETQEMVRQRLVQICGMSLPTLVIPKQAKFETFDGHTMWADVNPQPYLALAEKYKVPLWQLGVGCLYSKGETTS